MLKANYHTHTELCGHAVGKVKDYVEEAIRLNFIELGMSDHAHTPKDFIVGYDYDALGLSEIMTDSVFETVYIKEVLEAKKNDKIKVYLGLETEYFEEYHNYFVGLRNKVEYLILGLHFFNYNNQTYSSYDDIDSDMLKVYTEVAIKAMSTGLYSIFAHPDLFMYSYHSNRGEREFDEACEKYSKDIIEAAIKYDVYLEINANGINNTHCFFPEYTNYLYPREEFWRLAKDTDAKIIIGADAHSPKALSNDCVSSAIGFANKLGLKLCDFVEFKK